MVDKLSLVIPILNEEKNILPLTNKIIQNDKLYDFIQYTNIFWSDDFPFVNLLVIKFIKNSKNGGYESFLTFELFSSKSDFR